jgi:hypothetical protein
LSSCDAHGGGLLGGHDLGPLEGVDHLVAQGGDAAPELAGDDLLVRREHDVVELDREHELVGLQEQVLAVDREADLALTAVEHALDLQHALARDDDAALELRSTSGRDSLVRRWPSVETIVPSSPLLSNRTPLRFTRASSVDTLN